jgi:2',3'-cyclic-nucleotide 2'-phosphodiesterase (5'-nucleotidase family)
MKKFLLFVSVLFMSLAFIACDSDVLTSFQDDITAVEADIDTLTSDLADLETEVNALGTDLDAAETGISDLESDLSTINTTIGTIQASITAIEANIDTIEGNIATAQAKGDANAADIAALEADVADLETSLATLEASLLAIETAFNAFVDSQDLLDSWASTLTTDVVLMYNNDVHGRVEDDSYNQSIGFARIKNLIDEIRANYDNTFLVSAGDMFHGTTFATLEEGESFVDVMNAVGYDLMVPGNHDFDYGQDQLLVLEGLADFPLISSNIQYSADDSDMFDPYFIQTFGNIEVGFFGLTTPDTTYMTHPDNVIGLNFLDPIAQAQEMVDALEAEEVDIIVCLAHIGLDESSSITTEDVALAVDGIDLIIDGHSHSYLPQGNMVNDTIIVSASEYNKNFGVLKMTVEDGKIIAFHNNLINYTEAAALNYGDDEDVQALIDSIVLAQDAILSEVVGQTAVELDGLRDHVRTGETNLGKIITDAMITATGADIAITNGGGIRASIAAGDVTIGDVITVLPFGNIIVTLNVTGQDIIDSLEYGVSGLPSSSGKFPHVAGITFTVDLNNATGSRVTNVMVGGVPIDPLAIYSVATNDFMAAGGDGYVLFAASEKTGEFMGLHEALEAAFTIGVDIVIPSDTRITIIQPSS